MVLLPISALLIPHLFLTLTLAASTPQIHTGFCHGAFWPNNTAKTHANFAESFKTSQNLPNTPVSFNSARLFTSIQWNTLNDPISASQAAIDTNTTLLLGIWATNDSKNVDNELEALRKAFETHGQPLSELVIGLSIGNENLYRNSDMCIENGKRCRDVSPITAALSETRLAEVIADVKTRIANSSFAKHLKGKPIGHVDTASNVIAQNVDFVGINIYPYWQKDSIENANASFHNGIAGSIKDAGNTTVWITETGWPLSGPTLVKEGSKTNEKSVPSIENMQRYWKEVGCPLFGKRSVWWFELEYDSIDSGAPNWAVVNNVTGEYMIDFSCPGLADSIPRPTQNPGVGASYSSSSSSSSLSSSSSSLSTSYTTATVTASGLPGSSASVVPTLSAPLPPTPTPPQCSTTTTTIITRYECITVYNWNSAQTVYTTQIFTNTPCPSPPTITLGLQTATELPIPSMTGVPRLPDSLAVSRAPSTGPADPVLSKTEGASTLSSLAGSKCLSRALGTSVAVA